MALVTQTVKRLIDVGTIGNASTGDILYDGGVKINDDFNNIYNAFGDQRLFANDDGDNVQTIHATGYFQKAGLNDFTSKVLLGEQRDVDTSEGPITAVLDRGKLGECIIFINSNGSINQTNFFEINATDSFVSVPSGLLRITTPFTRITLRCVSVEGGVAKWDYSVENMFGNRLTPLDKTYTLSATKREINLATFGEYQTLKLLATCISTDGLKFKTSEILLIVDSKTKTVLSTEYAVIRKGQTNDEDEIYSLDFKTDGNFIKAVASSTTQNLQLALKVTSTQTLGVPV